ncbi:MAG: hypothetical protein H5T75_07775 [Coriobacteriia bacterium]|nr:hypothetical protein [Coriobacteriia bacterium]MDI6712951.1 hypothetical protein [Anaerosomatales bacterium]
MAEAPLTAARRAWRQLLWPVVVAAAVSSGALAVSARGGIAQAVAEFGAFFLRLSASAGLLAGLGCASLALAEKSGRMPDVESWLRIPLLAVGMVAGAALFAPPHQRLGYVWLASLFGLSVAAGAAIAVAVAAITGARDSRR